jgi:hypothetical protein
LKKNVIEVVIRTHAAVTVTISQTQIKVFENFVRKKESVNGDFSIDSKTPTRLGKENQ